jgi:alkylation response protein AidB-like acyl-CoA dehydrogenase
MPPPNSLDWAHAGWDTSAALADPALAAMADADAEIDRDGAWPEDAWSRAVGLGVSRWAIPAEGGGEGLDRPSLLLRGAQLAEASLTLAFIASQQDAAVRRLAAVRTPHAAAWLARIARGEALATVGLSHLTTSRRLGERPMAARPVSGGDAEGGYVLEGAMPWVTAATRADLIVTGAALEDGRQILVAIPAGREGVEVGPAMPLAALGASCTCEVRCRGVVVPAAEVLYGPAADVGKLPGLAGTGGLETSALAIGKARAAVLAIAREAAGRPEHEGSARDLAARWDGLARRLSDAAAGAADPAVANALRIDANLLVLRATEAYLTLSKGTGFLLDHPAQRWAREALFFLVWSCPTPVANAMIGTLAC